MLHFMLWARSGKIIIILDSCRHFYLNASNAGLLFMDYERERKRPHTWSRWAKRITSRGQMSWAAKAARQVRGEWTEETIFSGISGCFLRSCGSKTCSATDKSMSAIIFVMQLSRNLYLSVPFDSLQCSSTISDIG